MWLPDPSSIYFALLGGALFGFLSSVRHPMLRPIGVVVMLAVVALCFFTPQLFSEWLNGNEGVAHGASRIAVRAASFILASAVAVGILRWWKERMYDRLP